MPAEVLSYFFRHDDVRLKLRFQIVFQCAPFLKGLKVSSGIVVERTLMPEMDIIFRGTDIEYRKLSDTESKCFLLLYRRTTFVRYLRTIGIRSYLREWGYSEMVLEEMLDRLSQRMTEFAGCEMGFPHEIGIFLGYPIEDVRGFIKNAGKGYLFIGYWKVYSNPTSAKHIFNEYDRAKICAVNEFLMGRNIQEIIRN